MPDEKRVVHSRSKSICCGALQQLVRSRSGNYVTQNCTACGNKATTLALSEIPQIKCPSCAHQLDVEFVGKNYGCRCNACNAVFELGSILPSWQDEGFEYCGVAAPGDY